MSLKPLSLECSIASQTIFLHIWLWSRLLVQHYKRNEITSKIHDFLVSWVFFRRTDKIQWRINDLDCQYTDDLKSITWPEIRRKIKFEKKKMSTVKILVYLWKKERKNGSWIEWLRLKSIYVNITWCLIFSHASFFFTVKKNCTRIFLKSLQI